MPVSVTIDTLSTYTNHFFVPTIVDNFFLSSALWFKLRQKLRTIPGGDDIRVPVSYGNSSTVGRWAGRFATLPSIFQEHATHAVFSPRYYFASITLAKTDLAKNRGSKPKLLDMIASQSELAEMTFKDTLGIDVFKDGAVDANGIRGLDGLQSVITFNADPAPGSYGGISRASSSGTKNSPTGNAFWNANRIAANANGTTNFWKAASAWDNSTTLTTAKMQEMYSLCTIGSKKPQMIVTSNALYNKYWSLLTNTLRQMTDDEIGKFGFDSLVFNSTPVVVDDNIDNSGYMYFLNFDHLMVKAWDDMNFEATPFKEPPNQAAFVKQILFMGNLVCDLPHTQGLITGLTT